MKRISDQVSRLEIDTILRELEGVIKRGVVGDVVEFGCFTGNTSVPMAKLLSKYGSSRQLYLYDSFEGLPDKTQQDLSSIGQEFKAGELKASKKVLLSNFRRENLKMPCIKKAWFGDLLPSDIPEKISFAFLDGDFYQSIIDCLRLVENRMVEGGAILVDDYDNPSLPGAAKAVDEWLRGRTYRFRVERSLAIISIR